MAKINNQSRVNIQQIKRITFVQKLLIGIATLQIINTGVILWKLL